MNKNINISNNPKCLLILKKVKKFLNEKCSATGKNINSVVELYNFIIIAAIIIITKATIK